MGQVIGRKYRLIGHHVDPYSWQVIKLDTVITIVSEQKAINWAKQHYHRAMVNRVIRVE